MTRIKPIATVSELYPSEVLDESNKISYSEDLKKAIEAYVHDPDKNLTFFPIGLDGHMFHLILDGIVESQGIIQSERYMTHSFCFQLSDHLETKALDSLADSVFLRYPWIIEDYEYKSLVKKDKLWIKCKHKN